MLEYFTGGKQMDSSIRGYLLSISSSIFASIVLAVIKHLTQLEWLSLTVIIFIACFDYSVSSISFFICVEGALARN